MKKTKTLKVLALVLIVVLALGLAACGKKEGGSGGASGGGAAGDTTSIDPSGDVKQALTIAAMNMKNIKSMTYDIEMNMDMEIMGMEVATVTTGTMEAINEPLKMHANMKIDAGMLGGETEMEMYAEADGNKIISYTGVDLGEEGVTWMKSEEEIDMNSLSQYDLKKTIEIYAKYADQFEYVGEEEVNGQKTARFDGEITGDAINDVAESMGLDQQLGMSEGAEALEAFKDAGAMPVSFWVDPETGIVIKYDMDMSEVMNNITDKLLSSEDTEIEGEDGETMELSFGFTKLTMTMTMTGYNNVDDIVIPEEAKNAESI